ncbi:MAG: hypothetical protein HUJ31_04145, partial [Pseudomonadales bacterium]|nr:hypothetical protein [Pseudomonadales bacterium]
EMRTGTVDMRIRPPGRILLAEDTTGRGHKSKAVNGEPRQSLFIPLAD